MDAVADYLQMPPIAVYEVATFYSMYEHEKGGRHRIYVCKSISCHLRGAPKVIQDLEERLSIQCGETTEDGRFTLKTAECLGACVYAPVVQVGKNYHECVDGQALDEILKQYS
jgi:NADH-quinone oxidoreductase subunit E